MTTNNTTPQLLNPQMPDVPAHLPTIEPESSNEPQKIYLKDYTSPVFLVNNIDLVIELYDGNAKVTATLDMVRETAGDLVLLGRELQLDAIYLNDKPLSESDYQLDSETLTIKNVPDNCHIKTIVTITPQTNTSLEGLYQAGEGDDTMFVTQCEPEGFRKITFYPDRPDVLATFTTRIEADRKFPTLLANGNLLEKGKLADDRHFAVWQDPTKKPSYLFACVMADLDVLSDSYTTIEGRKVLLEVYAKAKHIDQCHVGMQALKDSMQWDEDHYGRPYDLDRYMIVAVSQFNMGAMENKGLNIFNTSCVLSSPETTTDKRNFNVKSVIAHEYFHNWTGNRITCRDWFQLCLKEGFTVFRDQSFSEDLHSPAVQRIDDVATLRAFQFPEDASPLAHPPRPDHFVEINNFYTATVYEKGAEIMRMIANTLGKEKFRQATDEYFRRFDGQAVTVEDMLAAFSVADSTIIKFLDWYTQAGTPVVRGTLKKADATLTISLSQNIRKIEHYPEPNALPIPIKTAIFNRATGELVEEKWLLLDQFNQDFVFENINFDPVVSLLRDFSAPVVLDFAYSDADLAFLVAYETNGFNQWQATQELIQRVLLKDHAPEVLITALNNALPKITSNNGKNDFMLASRLLDIPTEKELANGVSFDYDPHLLKTKRDNVKAAMATGLKAMLENSYSAPSVYTDTAQGMGERAWRNVVLDFALTAGLPQARDWAVQQYQTATCMSERMGALSAVVQHDLLQKSELLSDFYQRFSGDDLVMDLWFSLQASDKAMSVEQIFTLIEHADFDMNTPNRVRAVLGSFVTQPTKFWTLGGASRYLDIIAVLDKRNPLLASRLLQAFSNWKNLTENLKTPIRELLERKRGDMTSKNVKETMGSIL